MSTHRKIKEKNTTPPGGWRFLEMRSKMWHRSHSFQGLVQKVIQHREVNGYPPGNPEAEVEEFICDIEPGSCTKGLSKPPARAIKIQDVLRFTKTMAQHVWQGGELVSQEEANRRAEICASCVYNVPTDGCEGCHNPGISKAIKDMLGVKTTEHTDSLQTCWWCGCFNKVQIWFHINVLRKALEPEIQKDLPNHCWKK